MANLTEDRLLSFSGDIEAVRAKLTAAATYYKGSILQLDKATGLLKKPADVAGEFGFGVLKAQKVAAAGENPECEILRGKIWIPNAAAAQADVGNPVYVSEDNLPSKTALTSGGPCGFIVDVEVGVAWLVDFRMGGQKGVIG